MDKKLVTTSGGYDKLLKLAEKGKEVELSEKMIDQLTIISYFDDMWEGNRNKCEDEKLTKRQIIDKAYEIFRVDYSILYRYWTKGQDKLGLAAVMPKNALLQYIIEKSMLMINREEAKQEPDTKAVAMINKNLTTIALSMPDEIEEREPLPTPIFMFSPELLANHENLKSINIDLVLEKLRRSESSIKNIKHIVGYDIDYEEIDD